MGDAYIPLAEDGAGSLFYNPAGLGRVKEPRLEIVNFQLQANSYYVSGFGTNFYKIPSLPTYSKSYLSKNEGAFPGVSGAFTPTFAVRGFAVGMMLQNRIAAVQRGDSVRYRSKYQLIPTAGTGIRLASGVLRLGYSVQWVNQASGDISANASSANLGYNQGLAQGSALSHNAGFALTLPYAYLPALNVVARNVGGAKYSSYTLFSQAKDPVGLPETEPMSIDAAISFQPKTGAGGGFNSVFELRDATNTSGMPIMGRVALGLEWGFRGSFSIRGGLGSGYPSLGIGLKTTRGELNLSWFSEETGTSFRSERDMRFMMHYQIRAF